MLTKEYALSQLVNIEDGWIIVESDDWPPEEVMYMNCFHSYDDEKPKQILMLNWDEGMGWWIDPDTGRRFSSGEKAMTYLIKRYNDYWFRQLRKMLREREPVAGES